MGRGLAERGLVEQTRKGRQELAAHGTQAASLKVGAVRVFPHKGSSACEWDSRLAEGLRALHAGTEESSGQLRLPQLPGFQGNWSWKAELSLEAVRLGCWLGGSVRK